MSTSSQTPSASTATSSAPVTVAIALGSNLGDRRYNLARALYLLRDFVRLVRISNVQETEPVDAPAGSPRFLNTVTVGWTTLAPDALLTALLAIEARMGRVRRGARNAPRVIDLDLIAYGATRRRGPGLVLPHPRASDRPFVMEPLGEIDQAVTTFLRRP
jgi:2-amino-4-hydroxy-6-hydroxymethyldihydropteridine diphosphokinase